MSVVPNISNEYLQMTGSVARAGRRLQKYLETDQSKLQIAVAQLESAAQEHGSKSAWYQAFLFSQIEEQTPRVVEQPMTEGLLATVLADVQTANVLIAAGQAIGETGQRADPRGLELALHHLESVQQSVGRAQTETRIPGTFGFAEVSAAPSPPEVLTPERLAEAAGQTLHALVTEAQTAVQAVVDAIDQLGIQKIGSSLADLAGQAAGLRGIGRLFSQGIAKLRAAIDTLIRLMGGKALQTVQQRAEELWQDIKGGKPLTRLLEQAFGIESTMPLVEAARALPNLNADALARTAADLAQLKVRFQEDMALTRRLCSGVGVAAGVLALTPLGPQSTLVIAGVYAVIFAGVILLGMDYADSGRVLNRVRGVGQMLIDLGVARPGSAAAGTAV